MLNFVVVLFYAIAMPTLGNTIRIHSIVCVIFELLLFVTAHNVQGNMCLQI